MAFSNAWGGAIVNFFFNGTAVPSNYTGTNYYASLHTADPGVGGTQNTSEISYTGYTRITVVRTSSGFTASGKTWSNTAAWLYGAMSGGAGGTATHLAVGELSSGAGIVLTTGAVSPNIVVTSGVQPNFPIGSVVLTLT